MTPNTNLPKFILASASPRRRTLLDSAGLDFIVIPSGYDEGQLTLQDPFEFSKEAAYQKAAWVAESIRVRNDLPEWVLASDTVVYCPQRGRIYGKPISEEDAFLTLKELAGREHWVLTAVCLMNRVHDKVHEEIVVKSEVLFDELSDELLLRYIKTGEPMDKAGSYGIQDKGLFLVKCIHGSFSNIVGLPLNETLKLLHRNISSGNQ